MPAVGLHVTLAESKRRQPSSADVMKHRSHNSAVVLVIGAVLTVVGASIYNVLPLLATGAVDILGFSDAQVGVMSVAITVGSGISALLSGLWVRSVPWPRSALIGLGGVLVTNALAMLVHGYWTIVFMQGAAGFFATAVICLGLTILSDREESARGFGVSNAMQVVYQICAILAGPALLRMGGLNGVLVMLAGLSGLTMFLAPLLPAHGRTVETQGVSKGLLKPATLLSLLGFGIYFVNAGAYWTYVELMGQAQGMTPDVVANCVAAGVSAGILGGALAWALGDRRGRVWPLCISCAMTVAAALLLNGTFGVTAFLLAGLLYFFAWNYSVAYQLAIVNAVDTTGRGVAMTQAFAFFGSAGGAGAAAIFVRPGNYHAVIWLVVLAVCVSTALFALSFVLHSAADSRRGLAEALP